MSDKYIIEGVDGRWACDEPTPFDYAIEDGLSVRRITMYKNERVVLFMDYVVKNETRYVLYFEVAEFFRGKRWLNYVKELRLEVISAEHSEFQFLQPKVVYLKVSPWLAKTMPDILATRDEIQAVEKNIMKQLYIQGDYNDALE